MNSSGTTANGATSSDEPSYVPVYALEAALYTIPSTSTNLLYISKVDTSGLLATPAPSRVVTSSFLEYHLTYLPPGIDHLRIHVFASSHDMYLFPGSIDNKAKRVLNDAQLSKWWRSVLGAAALKVHKLKAERRKIRLHWLLPGQNYEETLASLPKPDVLDGDFLKWEYGHPYSTLPPPLPVPDPTRISISDLIPAFQDDPKSRYLSSLASSPIPHAGDAGDYDDVMERLHKLSEAGSALLVLRTEDVEEQRKSEMSRLQYQNDPETGEKVDITPDWYWETIVTRSECASGKIVGFFVLSVEAEASSVETTTLPTSAQAGTSKKAAPAALPCSVSHASYIRLWQAVHNVNYASLDAAQLAHRKWSTELHAFIARTGTVSDEEYARHVESTAIHVDRPVQNLKRPEPPKVTNLLVRKKKKVAA